MTNGEGGTLAGTMTLGEIEKVLDRIRYKDWRFTLERQWASSKYVLRVEFAAPDAYSPDGKKHKQYGRPWLLEPSSESELLQTVWLAIITAEEHEARETFTYDGRKIFNPHRNHTRQVSA